MTKQEFSELLIAFAKDLLLQSGPLEVVDKAQVHLWLTDATDIHTLDEAEALKLINSYDFCEVSK